MRALVRAAAFALVLFLIGPFAVQAQPTSSPTCQRLESELKSACCDAQTSRYRANGELFYPARSRPSVVAVNDCEGGTIQVRCLRRAAIGQSAPAPAPRAEQREDETQIDAAFPACRATWLSLREEPGAAQCALDNIPDCGAEVEISALPICEDLEKLSGTAHCSAWNIPYCTAYRMAGGHALYSREIELACLREWAAEEGEAAQKQLKPAFTADNSKLSKLVWPQSGPLPPGIVIPAPSQPDADSLAASERIIPGFRIEVPGNFWRYNTRVVAAAVIEQLGAKLAQGDATVFGVSVGGDCTASDLSCRFNQAHILNLREFIDKHRKFTPAATAGSPDQPQGLINAKVRRNDKGWEVSDLLFHTGPFAINWWGTVTIESERPLSFTLSGPDTRLKLLPLHDPKNQNAPYRATNLRALDTKARYLDRTWVLWGMPTQTCNTLRELVYDDGVKAGPAGSAGLGAGVYRTMLQPYKCECASPGPLLFGVNYCIVDPYPRPVNIPAFASGLPDANDFVANIVRINQGGLGTLTEVFCDFQNTQRVNRNLIRDLGPGPQTYFTSENVSNVFGGGVPPNMMAAVYKNIAEFGCLGRSVPRLAAGDPRRLNERTEPRFEGQEISSGIGFEFETVVDLGRIRAWISPAPITLEFPNVFNMHSWVKKKVPALGGFFSSIVGWIITFVLAIISVVLTVMVSLHLVWIAPVVTGLLGFMAADIDMGRQHVVVHGVISYAKESNERTASPSIYVDKGRLEVGVRRIVTTKPKPEGDTWVLEWSAPSCNDLVGGEGKQGFEEVLNFLKNTVFCPLEAIGNLYNVLTLPLKNLLLWLTNHLLYDIQGAVEQAITAAVIESFQKAEDDANLVSLMVTSLQESMEVPYHLIPDPDVKGELSKTQPHLDALCALAGRPLADCAVARIFAFYGEGPTITRLGAKTHYRSMQDYGVSSVTQIMNATPSDAKNPKTIYPPVRYCYGGDVPAAGLTDYSDAGSPGLLRRLTTLDEPTYTAQGSPPTDWRHQCASFTDMRVKGYFRARLPTIPDAEIVVAPSVRSNYFINEVFFCPDAASCDMGLDVSNVLACAGEDSCDLGTAVATAYAASGLTGLLHPVRMRATLATCSLMGDVWLRKPGPNPHYVNLLSNESAQARNTLVAIVKATCPAASSCAKQTAEINANFAPIAKMCRTLLTSSGLFNPARTLARSDFPSELLSPN